MEKTHERERGNDSVKKRQMTIKTKLLRDYLFSILVPIIVLGIILSYYISQLTNEKNTTEVVISNNKTYDNINSSFRSLTNAMNKFKTDNELDAKLRYHYMSYDVTLPFKDYNEFQVTMDYFPDDISGIKVYTSNTTIIEDHFVKLITPVLQTETWFQETVKRNGNSYFFYRNNKLYLSCMLKKGSINEVINIICIEVKLDKIHTILNKESQSIVIVDDTGHVIASNLEDFVGKKLEEVDLDGINNMGSGVYNYRVNEFDKAVITSFIPAEGNSYYKIVTFIHNSILSKQTLQAVGISFGITIGTIFIAFASASLFSKKLLRKLMLVKQYMHQVAKGDFSYQKNVEEDITEFDNLFYDLDTMSRSLSNLLNEVYEVTNQKNEIHIKNEEMKFKLLANQINPHFLINTLETIRMKAYINGDKEVADIVKCLGKMMRYNLEVGTDEINLEAEIEQIGNYIEIQKFRFNDRLNYTIDKDGIPQDYKILPLLIQPLVENSIIHGFEKYHKNMELQITFRTEEDLLKIIVMDNGCGISEEKLTEIRNQIYSEKEISKNHIGMNNIHQRVRLFYGIQYGIEINSEQNLYTEVILNLPLVVNHNHNT